LPFATQICSILCLKSCVDLLDLSLLFIHIRESNSDSENFLGGNFTDLDSLDWLTYELCTLSNLVVNDHLFCFEYTRSLGFGQKLFKLFSTIDRMVSRKTIFFMFIEQMALHLNEVDILTHGQVEVLVVGVCSIKS